LGSAEDPRALIDRKGDALAKGVDGVHEPGGCGPLDHFPAYQVHITGPVRLELGRHGVRAEERGGHSDRQSLA
jgi:hypothetical protein